MGVSRHYVLLPFWIQCGFCLRIPRPTAAYAASGEHVFCSLVDRSRQPAFDQYQRLTSPIFLFALTPEGFASGERQCGEQRVNFLGELRAPAGLLRLIKNCFKRCVPAFPLGLTDPRPASPLSGVSACTGVGP